MSRTTDNLLFFGLGALLFIGFKKGLFNPASPENIVYKTFAGKDGTITAFDPLFDAFSSGKVLSTSQKMTLLDAALARGDLETAIKIQSSM